MLTISIQAGGESSRMGEDKALRPFLGRPLIQRVIDRLAPIADEIIVTTNRPEEYSFLNTSIRPTPALAPGDLLSKSSVGHSVQRFRLVSDLKPGRGALGGLYTAIASAANPVVAVVACDMPFASASLIETASRLLLDEKADVVIAKSEEGFEPLHAVYRRETCLPAIVSAIAADQWKVTAWFPRANVRVLTHDEIQQADPLGLAFWNVNTPQEFARAEQLALGYSVK